MDVYMLRPVWYSVGVRGWTTELSETLLLMVDGRDVNAEFIGAPLWTIQYFSMDDIERIEVIRGPGSALYGANAFSGTVNVITKKPGIGPRASASLRGAEQGLIDVGVRGGEKFGPVSLGFMAGYAEENLWTSRNFPARDVIRARLDGRIDLGLGGDLLVETGVLQGSGYMHSPLGPLHLQSMFNYYGRMRYTWEDLDVQVFYDRTEIEALFEMNLYMKDIDITIATIPPVIGQVDKYGATAMHTWEVFHNRLTYGAEYVFNYYYADILVEPDRHEHRLGIYLQDEVNLSDLVADVWDAEIPTLLLTAGVRYDLNNITDWEFSPRASLVFAPAEAHSFRLGYAHAFLKPSFLQTHTHIYVDSELGLDELNVGEPDLRNRTIDSLELGYSASFFQNRLILKLDLAYNWYRDSIYYETDPSKMNYVDRAGVMIPDITNPGPGFGFFNNPEGSDGHDAELQVIIRPTERSRIFAWAGYRQVMDNQTNKFVVGEPVWRFASGFDLKTRQGWTISLRAFYTGKNRRIIFNPEGILEPDILVSIPGHWLVNAKVSVELTRKPFKLSAGLEGFDILGTRFTELGGLPLPNEPDYSAELLGRKIILFLHGEI
jgi:iron complex outermembrane receptor protein